MSLFFRGSQDAVLNTLFGSLTKALISEGESERVKSLQEAHAEVGGGAWLVHADGCAYEVVEPPSTIEQDVYGCSKGRACTSVPAALRPGFEEMIAQRTTADIGTDVRHVHWVHHLDPFSGPVLDVEALVLQTLGWPLVATAARLLTEQVLLVSGPTPLILHVTLLPDRVRLRVDDAAGLKGADPETALSISAADGHGGVLGFLTGNASRWGIVEGGRTRSVWADFARTAGNDVRLMAGYAVVPAEQIPAGSYAYRGGDHQAWVQVQAPRIAKDLVYLTGVDRQSLNSFRRHEGVPVFLPGPAGPVGEGPTS